MFFYISNRYMFFWLYAFSWMQIYRHIRYMLIHPLVHDPRVQAASALKSNAQTVTKSWESGLGRESFGWPQRSPSPYGRLTHIGHFDQPVRKVCQGDWMPIYNNFLLLRSNEKDSHGSTTKNKYLSSLIYFILYWNLQGYPGIIWFMLITTSVEHSWTLRKTEKIRIWQPQLVSILRHFCRAWDVCR